MTSTAAPYSEDPLMQFRQVRHRLVERCFTGHDSENDHDEGYLKVVGHYYLVQQKWRISQEFPHCRMILREEWRDLPVVEAKDA